MVIVVLLFRSKASSSSSCHSIIPAPYLKIATSQVFIAVVLLQPFNWELRIKQSLLLYSLVSFSFISSSLILSNSITPRYVYPSSTPFNTSLSGSLIPSHLTTFPLFRTRSSPNYIPTSLLNMRTLLTSESIFQFLANSFRSSMNNKWWNKHCLLPHS